MKNFVARQWFLVALGLVLAVGFSQSQRLLPLAEQFPETWLVAGVLFLMSWSLDSTAMWKAVSRPLPATLGVVVNLALVPLCAWVVSHALPPPLDRGLCLVAAVPCTLASAAVWTRRAGGNDAVALVVTMITNLSCFLTTPLLLWLTTGGHASLRGGGAGSLDVGAMVLNLIQVAVLPMAAGQLLRAAPPLGRWASRNKGPLSTLCQCGILTMVLVAAIHSGVKMQQSNGGHGLGPSTWLTLLAAVAVVHSAGLFSGFSLSRLLGAGREDWIAVGIAGSQKTLMIGLHIGLAEGYGLGILPIVVYHVMQLLIDTVAADRLRRQPAAAPEDDDAPPI